MKRSGVAPNQRLFNSILLGIFFLPAWPVLRIGGGTALGDEVQTMQMQVEVLRSLNDFSATAEQLTALERLAAGAVTSSPIPVDPQVKSAAGYLGTLITLRDALLGGDSEKINAAEQTVDDLENAHEIDDVGIVLTPAARSRAGAALKLFRASQIAAYMGDFSNDVEDPQETLADAIGGCRGLSPEAFSAFRESTASHAAELIAGVDATRSETVSRRIIELLDRTHRLTVLQFNSERVRLEAEARQIAGLVSGMDVLQHWMEIRMARLLANPQLSAMIAQKLQHMGGGG